MINSKMEQSASPLTPRSANRNPPTPAERRSPIKSPEKHYAHQDTENIPYSSPGGPPSSPLVENVESPSAKPAQSPTKQPSPRKESQEKYQHRELTEDALRENDDLEDRVERNEDDTVKTSTFTIDDDATSNAGAAAGYAGMDDTAFSAFSAVPNADMTRFARLGQSPTKGTFGSPTKSYREDPTPRPTSRHSPSRDRHYYNDSPSSPTPRRHRREHSSHDDDSTNLLVDFTGQFNPMPLSDRSPTRHGRLSPKKYHNDLSSYASAQRAPSPSKYPSTPSDTRRLGNLLDFDLPPAPTPRSMPSISARELESMKSAFQSQISSLKAELSGKEAEVSSLKAAMDSAERRVGEAQEQVREERGAKEDLQSEKTEWEKREQEMKDVLRSVKEEIVHSDREKDRLLQRATDAEYHREQADAKAVEAESKLAGLQAGTSSSSASDPNGTPDKAQTSNNTSGEVEVAVTKVAKELHTLYKSKHEAKVTALKKSYSDRWEKKIQSLSSQLDALTKENEDLRLGRDATITGVDPAKLLSNADTITAEEREEQKKALEAEKQRYESQRLKLETVERELHTLRTELSTAKTSNQSLQSQLDLSRAETAELIAATEELMALSQSAVSQDPAPATSATECIRSNPLSRSTSGSGLKAPGFGGGYGAESRIGGIRPPGSYAAGGSYSREKSESGTTGGKSGLLGNIERMGRGIGGGGERHY